MTIDAILDDVIRREGGFVDHPADRGGPTKYGVTLATLAEHRGGPVTASDVQNLSVHEAREIYRQHYYLKPGFQDITDQRLLGLVVDTAIHTGPDRAIRWLQAALDVPVDGKLGPQTIGMLKVREPAAVYAFVLAERLRHLGRIIRKQRSQHVFAEGWLNRVADFIEALG